MIEMKKDFEAWHRKKRIINEIMQPVDFHERDVWLCYLGLNVGHEQDGKGAEFLRPTIVFQKFGREVFWAIPLTSAQKETAYYFRFSFEPYGMTTAILSQIRLIDARRLKRKLGVVSEQNFDMLKQKFRALML